MKSRACRSRGLTLVELLVAIVIVVVVSALMAWILGERAARSSAG